MRFRTPKLKSLGGSRRFVVLFVYLARPYVMRAGKLAASLPLP
jgi:hypothetical protein